MGRGPLERFLGGEEMSEERFSLEGRALASLGRELAQARKLIAELEGELKAAQEILGQMRKAEQDLAEMIDRFLKEEEN
jgi:hypothetical protein